MTELIGFDVQRTETLEIAGEKWTAFFSKRRDGEEFMVSLVSADLTKTAVGHYSREVESDMYRTTDVKDLAATVLEILMQDARNKLGH